MDKKVVVITGASGGIGAALAKLLGSQGHQLVLAARREPELKEVAKDAKTRAITVVTDVRHLADMENLKESALIEFGHVDVWVNNAGRGISRNVMDLSEDDLDEMIRVNFKSAFYGMKCIIPHFQERGIGHLINVSSFLGRVPLVPYRSAYNAAKAALNSLTANLRMELKASYPQIYVSLIIPGGVATDFGKNALGSIPGGRPPGAPSAPLQTAEEVAAVIS
jgi:short-subunit dehydrogenase